MVSYEELLEAAGAFGAYQICMVIWFALTVMTLGGQMGFMAFGSLKPDVNLTSPNFPDNITDWTHISGFFSLASEHHLVGYLKYVPKLMITSQIIGMTIGSLVIGTISDRWGRKGTYLFALLILTVSSIGSVFANTWQAYCVIRALIGFGVSSLTAVLHVWCMEKLVSRWRLIVNVGGWPLGYMFCSVLAKYLRNWKDLTWALMGPLPILALGWIFIQESPKWLMVTGRTIRLHRVFQRIARVNRQDIEGLEILLAEVAVVENQKAKARANYTFINLFYNRRATKTAVGISSAAFALSFVYYGNLYDIGDISGSPSMNMIYIMIIRAIIGSSIPLIDYMIPKLGRKHMLSFGFFCFSSCLVTIISVYTAKADASYPLLIRVPYIVAMSSSSFLWSMLAVLAIESFPTVLRTTGFTFVAVCVRVAATISPQISLLGVYAPALPHIVYFIVVVFGFLASTFFITETKNKPLPDLPTHARQVPEQSLLESNGAANQKINT